MTPHELRQLAARHGVQATYRTNDGGRGSASRESLTAILQALGALDRGGNAVEAPEAGRADVLRLEPVHVVWEAEHPAIEVRGPAAIAGTRVELELTLESGEQLDFEARLQPASRTGEPSGGDFAYLVALPALPRGYHDLRLRHNGRAQVTMLIAAPRRCYGGDGGRAWGMFAPAYALHDGHTLGAGSVRELREFARWVASRAGTLLGTLPMLVTDMQGDPSPYRPLSRLFWNEHYTDISEMPIADAVRDELRTLARGSVIDHARIACLKRAVLEASMEHTRSAAQDDERLLDYARFRAAGERYGAGWRAWPQRMRDGEIAADDVDAAAAAYHAFAQRLITDQMERATHEMREDGVELYLDVPLGVHPDGYDAWRHRSLFVDGCSAGAPPDGFFSLGQNWAFPPQHPGELRRSGYAYAIAALRQHMRHAGLVRIDHVMGLHRLYVIPEGVAARDGAYLQYRAEEMYAILALESHRNRCAVVGENLGTVPGYINRAIKTHGLYGMYVAQFEAGTAPDGCLRAPAADAIASMDTHDTPTFAAFWEGRDIGERLARGLLHEKDEAAERAGRTAMCERVARALNVCVAADAGEVFRGWMTFLAESPARYVIANTEDLWLETEPQNRPGTSTEYPNWRRRFAKSIEEMREDAGVERTTSALARVHDEANAGTERTRAT
ncbi:MAG TPA: 4-alpha-glucanotransferase [Dehalococcoidia bacterium]|nr:4-alpha-glucanotransferase [Dehalococcoidia bacterium]